MDGHADTAPEINGLNELADFLSDTPEKDPEERKEAPSAADATAKDGDTADAANPEQDAAQDDAGDADEADAADPDADEDADPAPERKIAIKIKAEDGTETTQEVAESELVKGYQRQADYTRKTQQLVQREHQAVEILKGKHDEIRQQYLSQAELARAAVVQLAGFKTEAEMAQLANSDPAAWVAQNQRQQQIAGFLSQLDGQISGQKQQEQAQAQAARFQSLQQQGAIAWQELAKEKIDGAALTKIYGDASKSYGFSAQELDNVYDHRLVKMMRDASAYRALKAQRAEVTKQATEAPRMPPSRQSQPAQERRDRAMNDRFKGGRAKLNDLAAFLA
jgi:hypothetical protein